MKITLYKYPAIFICSILLLFLSATKAVGEDYIKNIEVGESSIKFVENEFNPPAYLYLELKNNGDKNVANLTFEISYYDAEGYLLQKAVVKNALTDSLPKKETRKYRIRLNGDVINIEHEQYPYSQHDKVGDFDIKILKIKFGRK